jgi:hypothetical protein
MFVFDVVVALTTTLDIDVAKVFGKSHQTKRATAQRLNDEAGIAQIIRDLEDRQVGLLFDIAKAVRDRSDARARK